MKNVFKRIFKTLLTSLLVTFFAMLVLMIGNKIMGVERVGIVYLILGGLCFSMLFVGLIFARQDKLSIDLFTEGVVLSGRESPKSKNERYIHSLEDY